jgi:hypothetical protein
VSDRELSDITLTPIVWQERNHQQLFQGGVLMRTVILILLLLATGCSKPAPVVPKPVPAPLPAPVQPPLTISPIELKLRITADGSIQVDHVGDPTSGTISVINSGAVEHSGTVTVETPNFQTPIVVPDEKPVMVIWSFFEDGQSTCHWCKKSLNEINGRSDLPFRAKICDVKDAPDWIKRLGQAPAYTWAGRNNETWTHTNGGKPVAGYCSVDALLKMFRASQK